MTKAILLKGLSGTFMTHHISIVNISRNITAKSGGPATIQLNPNCTTFLTWCYTEF